jgi:hypothetical protein
MKFLIPLDLSRGRESIGNLFLVTRGLKPKAPQGPQVEVAQTVRSPSNSGGDLLGVGGCIGSTLRSAGASEKQVTNRGR